MHNVTVTVQRRHLSKNSITGHLVVDGKVIGVTLEYPWRNNTDWDYAKYKGDKVRNREWNSPRVSCLPDGTYAAEFRVDHKTGKNSPRGAGQIDWRLELHGTNPRTDIELHVGNTLKNSEGCILCGRKLVNENGTNPQIEHSDPTTVKLATAILGDISKIHNASDLARVARDVRITVRIVTIPQNPKD